MSFDSWSEFPSQEPRVVQICHPDWRGIRAAAYAFGSPVIEVENLDVWGETLVAKLVEHDVEIVVVQGWPPGSAKFARECVGAGVSVKCVLHSSPALQGDSPAEASVIVQALELRRHGIRRELATVKLGVSEAFAAIGLDVSYLPNSVPDLGEVPRRSLGPGFHIGVFGEPWWPKNITTQVLGALMVPDSVVHITKPLLVDYFPRDRMVIHGEASRPDFISLLGSMDLNLYATFTECHPQLPIESFLLGVPCLVSANSVLFRDDPELWRATVVISPDEPAAIVRAIEAIRLRDRSVIDGATKWIEASADAASSAWGEFLYR